jgi:hypothetical protein
MVAPYKMRTPQRSLGRGYCQGVSGGTEEKKLPKKSMFSQASALPP